MCSTVIPMALETKCVEARAGFRLMCGVAALVPVSEKNVSC